jgi:chromate transporter
MNLYKIFISTLKLAFLSFGGGVATISLINDEFVVKHQFISPEEFKEIVVMANSMPGATMTQIISYISYKQCGLIGFLVAFITLLFTSPLLLAFIIFFAHSYVDVSYIKAVSGGILPVVLAMISVFAIQMLKTDLSKKNFYNFYFYFFIFCMVLLSLILKINIALIFIFSIFIIIIFYHINSIRLIRKNKNGNI